jgi:glucose-1-phosphate adenylyltransferase
MAVILAGGKGTRLEPLTRDRAKPAVPFGGAYRIIDFALSNCLNSGLRKLMLLTQYKAISLDRHINNGWRRYFCTELGEFVTIIPPQQRIDEHWYQGTADAVYQNIYTLENERPDYVLILAGDHIYKMNYFEMLKEHIKNEADLTISALPVSINEARQFGVMEVNEDFRICGFQEKPSHPKPIPGDIGRCLASMGVYVFSTRFLFEQLLQDANTPSSSHDFGKDIIPSVVHSHRVFAYPFNDENRKSQAYWRDVGTIDAYYEANLDLVGVDPLLNLYDRQWPIRTLQNEFPPPKFVFGSTENGEAGRVGMATDSIVCQGAIVSGGKVERSILGTQVRINSFAHVSDSILFDRVEVGRHARIHRAIIDKNVIIPPGMEIGVNLENDRSRGLTVTESGIVVIGKSDSIPHQVPGPHFTAASVRNALNKTN